MAQINAIVTLGFGTFAGVKFLPTMGFLGGTTPPPVITATPGGGGDESARQRRKRWDDWAVQLLLMDE